MLEYILIKMIAALAYPILITAGLIVVSAIYIVIIKLWAGDV